MQPTRQRQQHDQSQALGDSVPMERHLLAGATSATGEELSAACRKEANLGTFLGVFVPCTCTIFGVVVFLRLGFVVGEAGIWWALLIVLGSFAITLLTTLSLCALISDGGDGATLDDGRRGTAEPGIYCAVRKSVGPQLGAALGTAFYLAFVVDVAFYAIGFSESVAPLLNSTIDVFPWNPPGTWIDTSIASAALAALALVTSRGVRFTALVSLVTLCAIVGCIGTSLVGLAVPSDDPESGRTAFDWATFRNNTAPDLTPYAGETQPPSLMLMFVLVFPGFTGVLAGSNLSGALDSPGHSIARGSLLSLLFVAATYGLICLTLGGSVPRAVLQQNLRVMVDTPNFSLHFPLGQIGVACTTLSSALSYLLGAPRVLLAVSHDAGWAWLRPRPAGFGSRPGLSRPGLSLEDEDEGRGGRVSVVEEAVIGALPAVPAGSAWHARDERPARVSAPEPLRPLLLTWGLAQLLLLTGTVDLLAPLVTGLFLLAFCLINLIAFLADVSRAEFAPRFRLHSASTALLGFLLSFVAMSSALVSSVPVTVGLFLLLGALLFWQRRALRRLLMQGQMRVPTPSALRLHRGHASTVSGAPHEASDDPFGETRSPVHPARRRAVSLTSGGLHAAHAAEQLQQTEGDSAAAEERIERAAVYIHDALQGRCLGSHWAIAPTAAVRAHRSLRAFRALRRINVATILLLGLVERPSWCYAKPSCGQWCVRGVSPCAPCVPGTAHCVADVPVLDLPVLPSWATLGLEACCCLLFSWEMSFKVTYMGRRTFFSSPVHLCQLLLLLLDAGGIAVSAVSPGTLTFLNPIIRPLLFVVMSSRAHGDHFERARACARISPRLWGSGRRPLFSQVRAPPCSPS